MAFARADAAYATSPQRTRVLASPADAPTMTLFRTRHQNHHHHSPNLSFTPPTLKRKGGVAFPNPPLEYFTALTANSIHSTSSASLSVWNDITAPKPTSSIDDYAAKTLATSPSITPKELDSARHPLLEITTHKPLPISATLSFRNPLFHRDMCFGR